jgi:DNA helicase HerA-like ATPase
MSSQVKLGNVVDESTPFAFTFRAAIKTPIALHDYVIVKVNEPSGNEVTPVDVIGEIVGIGSKNPAATERLVTNSPIYSYKMVHVEILGYMNDGVVRHLKSAPDPGVDVFRADDTMLQKYFGGIDKELPISVGTLLNRPKVKVPIHLQGMQFHAAILAASRAGKSYLAGGIAEQILSETKFAVVVLDMHGDYVKMNTNMDNGEAHGKFKMTVYYPANAPHIDGVTAEVKELKLGFDKIPIDGIVELLGQTIGERQIIIFKRIIKDLKAKNTPFSVEDVIAEVRRRLAETDDEGTPKLRGEDRSRYEGLLDRLEDLDSDIELSPTGIGMEDLIKPGKLSVICLNGVQARIQDATTSIIIDQIYRHLVSVRGDRRRAVPTFLLVEEAHRVASPKASPYAVKAISTATREGSKFGLFMVLISQRPRSIDADVLANIGNYAVLRITNSADQMMIEAASESFSKRLIEDLPSLNQGEAVLVGPWVPLPAHIKTMPRKTKHFGVTPNLKDRKLDLDNLDDEREEAKW